MERISLKLLKYKGRVSLAFILFALFGLLLAQGVRVNFSMTDYLPPEAASTVAMDEMHSSFEKSVPNLRIMIHDVTIPEAIEIKNQIRSVSGVEDIDWLDDAADILVPIPMHDEKILTNWYVDENVMYSVVISDDNYRETLADIRSIIGDDGAISGSPVETVEAQRSTSREIGRIMLIVIPAALIILIMAMTSWIEPFILLLNLGIAIGLNMGTNIFLGEISFVTNTTAVVLQLACTVDYSIFLLHRFGELRKDMADPVAAMARAVAQSVRSITSSGLTTVVGFLSLVAMQFGIGADMGIVLAKGIVFSLLTTLFCMPCLTMCCYKLIDKTSHRSLLPSFKRFAAGSSKVRGLTAAIVLILLIPSFLAGQHNEFTYGMSKSFPSDSQVAIDKDVIAGMFGESQTFALLVPNANAGGALATESEMIAEIKRMPEVSSVTSYTETIGSNIPSEYVPDNILDMFYSSEYSRIIVTANTEAESKEAFMFVESLRETADKHYPDQYHLAGEVASVLDMRDTITSDRLFVNLLSIGGIALILLLTFRSLSLPVLLLLTIESAIFINMAVPYFSGQNLNYIGYLIISSVQLGATVDYAILFANRYMSLRRQIMPKEAVRRTITDTAGSIFTSGIILTMAGLVLGLISTNMLISQLGMLLARGAALSAILVLIFLPGLLTFFDPVISKTTWKAGFVKRNDLEHAAL